MRLRETLQNRLKGTVVVVGVGYPLHGDDGAGCRVAQHLRNSRELQKRRHRVRIFDAQELPENILGQVVRAQPDTVVFVDAADLDAQPGAVAVVEQNNLCEHVFSTHGVSLSVLMKYLSGETGADVFLLAIQPHAIGPGLPLSPKVAVSSALLANILEETLVARSSTGARLSANQARGAVP